MQVPLPDCNTERPPADVAVGLPHAGNLPNVTVVLNCLDDEAFKYFREKRKDLDLLMEIHYFE